MNTALPALQPSTVCHQNKTWPCGGWFASECVEGNFCGNWNNLISLWIVNGVYSGCSWVTAALYGGRESSALFHGERTRCGTRNKTTTHQHAMAWCVAWLMHELMWIFPPFSGLFISLEQRAAGFICIFNQPSVFVPSSTKVTFSTERSRTPHSVDSFFKTLFTENETRTRCPRLNPSVAYLI